MKLANAVMQYLKEQGIGHVFCISGGASLHLIHACADEGVPFVCPQTEQSASFAADAYARLRGLGCAIATSGPGGTNLLTGIAAAYYDSVPVVYLVGQVTVARRGEGWGVRQYGFQFTPIVDMVKCITKYAAEPLRAEDVLPCLWTAVRVAREGRPGPVLLSLPDDVQRMNIT